MAALGKDGPSGIPQAAELWLEWERGSHRQCQLVWSRGLCAAAGLGKEQTDEEIAAEPDNGERSPYSQPGPGVACTQGSSAARRLRVA